MFNKKCIVEYDGTNFSGWQVQPGVRTVQFEIEKALKKIYKKSIHIAGSGRTDSGVHALNQVFNFRTEKFLEDISLFKGLNSLLPDDVVIKSVKEISETFHSQKSSKHKTYIYQILNRDFPSALERKRSWWIRWKIDLEKFETLFVPFVGEHDFSSMCIKRSLKKNNIRKVNFIRLNQVDDIIYVEIDGDGFLHNMVRNIVGTAKDFYYQGKSVSDIVAVLESKDRDEGGATAPPHGLYLKEVFY